MAAAAMLLSPADASAQFNIGKAVNAGSKLLKAATLSDEQMAAYAKESVDWMDTHNKVSDPDSEYTKRLNRLTAGLKEADGIPLNFKVYEVIDVNAFACPDARVHLTDGHHVGRRAARHHRS